MGMYGRTARTHYTLLIASCRVIIEDFLSRADLIGAPRNLFLCCRLFHNPLQLDNK
jgi:hypothetical protein